MSKFTEIVKQANRMCLFYKDCSACPIHAEVMSREGEYKYECGLSQLFTTNIELLEAKILRWAKEHPKDIYPSWKERRAEASHRLHHRRAARLGQDAHVFHDHRRV